MEKYTLFFKEGCPFCNKVRKFGKKYNIAFDLRDINEGNNLEDLIKLGGDDQVPALLLDNEIMYESDDIMCYIAGKENIALEEEDFETVAPACPI